MTGIEAIAKERRRQIEEEGWTAEHDAQHTPSDLAAAAACYALAPAGRDRAREPQHAATTILTLARRELWPWDEEWWKPRTLRRDLERAGALCAAALDRLNAEEKRQTETRAAPPIRLRDMTMKLLVEQKFDGLYSTDEACGCLNSDLAPCGGDPGECCPGVRRDFAAAEDCRLPGCEGNGTAHWHIEKGEVSE